MIKFTSHVPKKYRRIGICKRTVVLLGADEEAHMINSGWAVDHEGPATWPVKRTIKKKKKKRRLLLRRAP